MQEIQMCCGTTCDKVLVVQQFKKVISRVKFLESLLSDNGIDIDEVYDPLDNGVVVLDGMGFALLGYEHSNGIHAVYDMDKIVTHIMEESDCKRADAIDAFYFNIAPLSGFPNGPLFVEAAIGDRG